MSEELQRDEILSAGPDDGDWTDVLRRTKRARRRQGVYGVALLTALVVVGIASAYALGHPVVDFGAADTAPYKAVAVIGSSNKGVPEGSGPGVLAEQARKIPGLSIDGKPYEISVAPTKDGGFCISFPQGGGASIPCIADDAQRRLMGKMSLAMSAEGDWGPFWIGGIFLEREGERLEVVRADGSSDDIPFVWVTAPINAGFFAVKIPNEDRVNGHGPVSVALFDRDGILIERQSILDPLAQTGRMKTVDLPGYPNLTVPVDAIWEKRRQLFDLRAENGARVGFWVAPTRDRRTCVWGSISVGCFDPGQVEKTPPLELLRVVGMRAGGSSQVALGDRVGAGVTRVEARFEDGDKVELTPKEGYLIWPIPSRHNSRGHRLEELVAFDAGGHVLAEKHMSTTEPGMYPCDKPKVVGGVQGVCP
jgi:hypothetical protein